MLQKLTPCNVNLSSILFSCRTVEVNNTDAEGRLVLGDGVCKPAFEQFDKISFYAQNAVSFLWETQWTYTVSAL